MSATYQLGVDLGTTYTCAALLRDGRVEVCQLGQVSQLVPSVVSVRDDGEVLTGEAADRRSVTHPERTVREFKRRFGDPAPVVLGGVPYGIERVSSFLLRAVVDHVGQVEGAPPVQVGVTHPAAWGDYKLDLLREACRVAGIEDPRFVAEPVAAAVAYGTRASIPEGSNLLVYDLGGGTFDAAVVRTGGPQPTVVGTPEGLERFGGIDLDQAVLGHVDRATDGRVLATSTEDGDARAALARLRHECTAAKEALSSDTEVDIPVLLPGLQTSVRLTRAELEAMIGPRLEDTIIVSERVVTGAGLSFQQIDRILLVGGSSRIPMVGALLRERTGRPVAGDANPKLAVASGAALVVGGEVRTGTIVVPVAEEDVLVAGEQPPAPPGAAVPPTSRAPSGVEPADSPAPISAPPGGRRRARGRVVAAVVAILVVAGVAGAVLVLGGGGSDDGDGGGDGPLLPAGSATPLGASTVAYASLGDDGAQDLELVDVDTGTTTPLVATAGFDGFPAVSPDRRLVAYAHSADAEPATGARLALRVINADGSGTSRILASDLAADGWVAWSPDGSELAFPVSGAQGRLVVLDLESGSRRTVTNQSVKVADPTWSADGATIAYASGPDGEEEIRAVPADGSGEPTTIVSSEGADANPAFAPVGDRLAFTTTRDGRSSVYLADGDGSGPRPLVDGGVADELDPRWSPDAARLAFVSLEGSALALAVVNADGSDPRAPTPPDFRGQVSWSA